MSDNDSAPGSIDGERTPSAGERWVPAWLVGLTGLGIGLAIALRLLIPSGMDPTILLAFGEESSAQTEYARALLGEVITRPGLGHDGKYYFIQANDPWFLSEQTAVLLERPIYRGERMLYPLIAGGFGLLPPRAIVWSMLFSNVLALALGAWLGAKLALLWDAPAWLGLLVPLNIGLLFELELSGAGILAYTCCLAALYALERDRTAMASFLFGAAALSREVMVVFAIGVLVLIWREHRRFIWPIVAMPIAAVAAWQVYLRFQMGEAPQASSGEGAFAPPFLGIFEAMRVWVTRPDQLIVNVTILAIIVMFSLLGFRSRLPIVWGALPFVGLATILSAAVWRETFDLTRAISPVFTAVPFLVVISASGASHSLDDRSGEPV